VSALVLLGVGLLGGLGSVGRHLISGSVMRRTPGAFPTGTLAVNLSGALLLGALVGAGVGGDAYRLWGVGLIGGFTTFSTWVFESQRLAEEEHHVRLGVLNLVVSLILGVVAVLLGRWAAGLL
jgi:fluoride exporter